MTHRRCWLVVFAILLVLSATSIHAQEPADTIMVASRAFIFYGPSQVERDSMERRGDSNLEEVLDDYLLYASRIHSFLDSNSIKVYETTARQFIIIGKKQKPVLYDRKLIGADVGYILVQKGKKPKLLAGVHTDDELRQIASEYYGLHRPKRGVRRKE